LVSDRSDNTVKIWDATNLKYIRSYSASYGIKDIVAFGEDTSFSSDQSSYVSLLSIFSCTQIGSYSNYTFDVRGFTLSPDKSMIACTGSSSFHEVINLWISFNI
jgi:WD40 repeat protein